MAENRRDICGKLSTEQRSSHNCPTVLPAHHAVAMSDRARAASQGAAAADWDYRTANAAAGA